MKVRPGDNITLYCDRSLTHGSIIVWIRNCSHENQPSLEIDFTKWGQEIFQHFSSLHDRSSNSYDLHITNISVSDLGLYYCAEVENKVNYEKGIIYSSKVYYYGNRKTRLSLAVSPHAEQFNITSTPRVSDCVLCWTLLFSVCPRDPTEKHQCETRKTGKICLHTEVSYRLLTSEHPYAKM
ncbi:hypothetical protein DPX16_14201 [Anabarilius grahami]|uniref:Ig-like domain-containing protein n=1 Tax=Anabarilius grahami TaxID=495550 RepID=A0A3N0XHU3_ANAGA|nr:hypothetical protein DPX16_14201 [Anabarilius grahami]